MTEDRPVRHLANLYYVVAGLALTVGVTQFFDASGADVLIRWRLAPTLFAFILTVIPFSHGALQYL